MKSSGYIGVAPGSASNAEMQVPYSVMAVKIVTSRDALSLWRPTHQLSVYSIGLISLYMNNDNVAAAIKLAKLPATGLPSLTRLIHGKIDVICIKIRTPQSGGHECRFLTSTLDKKLSRSSSRPQLRRTGHGIFSMKPFRHDFPRRFDYANASQ
jgi:hypothetical protein